MMVSKRTRRTREFTGPTPHSVAILARPPNKRPPEYLILERRKQEEMLQEYTKNTQYIEMNDLRNEWERGTDRKIKLNTAKRKVRGLMQANQSSVEDRRERLRELLQSEEEQYLQEMEAKEETVLERQAKMRERAKSLKERREDERLQFVQEKFDQQFRNQCEELRSTLSKRQQDQVCAERLEQLRIKDEMERDKMENESLYADLWEKDRLAKAAKEEKTAMAAHDRNREVLIILRKQMAALQQQKEADVLLKQEEAQLLREQAIIRRLEAEKAQQEKLTKQKETRDVLDHSLKLKMKKRAKEEQEQLAFDLKMLENLLEESRNETMEQMQRKKELREEDRIYREYLFQLMDTEKSRQRELEALINEEVEKMWQKRLSHWQLEREARRKLMKDVLATRAEQVQERLRANEKKQMDSQREREELLKLIEENQRTEKEQKGKLWSKNQQYQQDLEGQIHHNYELRKKTDVHENEEYVLGLQAEREYQQKLKGCLSNPTFDKLHPMRRLIEERGGFTS